MLAALPLTPNGKIDRRQLPRPYDSRRSGEKSGSSAQARANDMAPRHELERAIAQVWQDALQIEEVGARDNFFELGGHSLLLAQVRAKLRETLKREIPMSDLFQFPTIETLARHLGRPAGSVHEAAQKSADRAAMARQALARMRPARQGK
jgi:acyl carrier protein